MIIGLLLRNFKTYSGINYIPISNGKSFCGLVGNNGIGKSSVLEALDSYFNGKSWNYNIITKKSGMVTTRPHITPIFLISKDKISEENKLLAESLSNVIWEIEEADVLSQNREQFKSFASQKSTILLDKDKNDYFLLPIGITHDNFFTLSIFNTKKTGEYLFEEFQGTHISDDELQKFHCLLEEIKSQFEFIYIPKDIDPENFTQLETKEIQSLMGETLMEIIGKCVPRDKIYEINKNLNEFIDSVSDVLEEYSFRTGGERQVNLKKHDVYKLIIEAYFKIRKLHKKEGAHWLEISALSSGEKQKAIIELAYHFLKSYRNTTNNLILGIDEPESSLHMSACFDQFNKLFEISELCNQLLFTTHWYGFIPTIENGCVTVISREEKDHVFDLITIDSYREAIKQTIRSSKGKLPFDIRLKSINDFTQSVVTSILTEDPYNWMICEGSSEKIYFEGYYSDIIKEKKLRIIPVGGAREIKRIYQNLLVAYEEFKNEIKGKVILISDTDAELVQYETRDEFKNLLCYRIVNSESKRKTELVRINSNPVSPKTEIEDALNGKLFLETLLEFELEYPEIENILSDREDYSQEASFFSLDLSPSKAKLLNEFLDKDNNKFRFANLYVSRLCDDYEVPEWIQVIKDLY